MIPGAGERVKLTLTLELNGVLPPSFHWGTLAQHLIARTPFKLIAADVEIPGSTTRKPKSEAAK
jgi:hypothetical protein